MGADDSDFNPGFSFDFGGLSQPTQAAWEFSGALKEAKAEQARLIKTKATSIDDKIQSRLKEQQAKSKAKAIKRGRQQSSDDEDDEASGSDEDEDQPLPGELDDDDDSEGDGEDLNEGPDDEELDRVEDVDEVEDLDEEEGDEDEVDEEDDDGMGIEEGSEEEGSEEGSSEEEEEEVPPPVPGKGKQQTQQQSAKQAASKAGATAAASKQAVANGKHQPGQAHSEEGSDEEQGPGSEAEARQQKGASTSGRGGQQGGGSGGFYAQLPDGTSFKAASFGDLNLSRPLTRACAALGYATPTPIQAAVIPLALAGRDICGSAVTGSGKTAAFALPCLERLLHRQRQIAATYVLVLTPTRELAVQIHSMMTKLAQFTDVSIALVVGGLSVSVQSSVLRRSPEVVVATPGRMIDHLRNTQSVGLEDLAVLVLDEADRLLEMGFKDEIFEIVKMTPKKRQTMLFSATFNEEVRKLMALSLKQPVRLAADAAAAIPRDLKQELIRLKGAAAAGKEAALLALCSRSFKGGHAIVFFRTKQRAHRAKILFGLLGLPQAAELHGDMTQAARLESLELFRQGKAAFLLATDVAARGLDIPGVQVVINYDAPKKLETHLHRIGRTARAGAAGVAVTFVEDGDRALLKEVIKKTKAVMTQRLVPPAAIAAWQSKVEGAAEAVSMVYGEEREEKELRKAEMEAAKMQNMIDHEDEIKSRPARTWFQSERQRKETLRKAAQEAAGQDDGSDEEGAQKSKAQAKQDAKNDRRAKRKLEAAAAAGSNKRRDVLKEETGEFDRAIKSAKSKLRALREQGLSARKAQQIVAAQAAGVKGKSGNNKKRKTGGDGGGLFSGDGTGRPGGSVDGGSGGSGGGTDFKGKALRARDGLNKAQLNKVKRGGVGKASFKSKAKYKRKR